MEIKTDGFAERLQGRDGGGDQRKAEQQRCIITMEEEWKQKAEGHRKRLAEMERGKITASSDS